MGPYTLPYSPTRGQPKGPCRRQVALAAGRGARSGRGGAGLGGAARAIHGSCEARQELDVGGQRSECEVIGRSRDKGMTRPIHTSDATSAAAPRPSVASLIPA